MKILLDARLYGLEHAGLGRYAINLIEELKKIDSKNDYAVLLRNKYFNQLKFPKNWKKVLADFRHYSLAEQTILPKIISKEKPDLVHFLHMNIPVFYGGKFIVTVHDLLMQKHRGSKATTLPFFAYFPKLLAAKLVFRHAVFKSEKIIVPSCAVKEEVAGFYRLNPKKIVVTYEGVNLASFKPSRAIDRPYFIYVGNAYPHKNLERAIKALASKKMLFVIVSSRSVFTEKLKNDIENLKAEKYVRLLGFVPDSQLGTLLKNSLGFIYPSLSEGFGLPGLEAMAAGTLVLVSDIPVFKEVYKDVPIYFDPYDVNSIKSAVEKAVSMSDEERNKIIEKGKELVKNYSWSKMAKETLKIYEGSTSLRSD